MTISKVDHILKDPSTDSKTKEQLLVDTATELKNQKYPCHLHRKAKELADLIRHSKDFLSTVPKARTAKLVKTLVDLLGEIPEALPLQIEICKETIEWAKSEKRVFLRQSLETRLIALYAFGCFSYVRDLESKAYSEALVLIASLLKELKKLDDKQALMEVQWLESRVYHQLRNLPKSRAALTSARTSANSIYCPPLMQAQLDMQSGILHAEEKDYKTAYSYFYETLENYSSQDHPTAVVALKYMLLCKIMLNLTDDVHAIIHGKLAARYQGVEIEAMKAVATAYSNRSLRDFEQALVNFKNELGNDPFIRSHFAALYDTLLEHNLLRIIEPYTRVEIAHVAKLIQLPSTEVEKKLSKMILDKAFSGILDQGAGCLEVFEENQIDETYEASIETVKAMNQVVEALYEKAARLT